jgi:hypothetical protein
LHRLGCVKDWFLKEDSGNDTGIASFRRTVEPVTVHEELCDSLFYELCVPRIAILTPTNGLEAEELLMARLFPRIFLEKLLVLLQSSERAIVVSNFINILARDAG